VLQASAIAVEKSFSAKTNIVFLGLLLIWFAVLLLSYVGGYLGGART
jgi:hypothetical protein